MTHNAQYSQTSWIDPRIRVQPSPTHGKGMFASAPVRRGEVVVVWGGTTILTREDIRCGKGEGYSWATIGEGLYLAAPDEGDDLTDAMNHSCDPNVWMADEVTLVARRDIAIDEELTLDYCLIEGDEDWAGPWECRCGSALCRGGYTGRDWRRPDLQEHYRGHFSPFINERIRQLNVACDGLDGYDDRM